MHEFQPIRLLEVELGRALPEVWAIDVPTGRRYGHATVLVRLHDQPLGLVELALGQDGVSARQLARRIWASLGEQIAAHLCRDGLREVDAIDAAGLPSPLRPACLIERDRILGSAPFISVVVSTRDRPDVLARCLRSVLAVDYPRFEVLVIDNAPTSQATEELVQREYGHLAHVRYIREDRPGLSRARNRGVTEARGEIVAFTDDDVVVDRYWLAGLVQGFGRAGHAGCVTGLVLPMELETQPQLWFEEFGGFGKGCQGRIYDIGENRPSQRMFPYAAGQFGSGNNMAFKAAVLRQIGRFDPALGAGSPTHGGEDLAAFVAVLRKGFALVYEPAAIVHHQHRRDYSGLRKHIYDCGVGLTAFLTKCAIDDPRSLVGFAAKVPFGMQYALSTRSAKNRKKRANYPAELTRLELMGMLRGPFDYLRARWLDSREQARLEARTHVRTMVPPLPDELEMG